MQHKVVMHTYINKYYTNETMYNCKSICQYSDIHIESNIAIFIYTYSNIHIFTQSNIHMHILYTLTHIYIYKYMESKWVMRPSKTMPAKMMIFARHPAWRIVGRGEAHGAQVFDLNISNLRSQRSCRSHKCSIVFKCTEDTDSTYGTTTTLETSPNRSLTNNHCWTWRKLMGVLSYLSSY